MAEAVIIVTPEGFEYVYSRGENGMNFEGKNDLPFEVAPATLEEYNKLRALSRQQARTLAVNRPEYVMYQDDIINSEEQEQLKLLQSIYHGEFNISNPTAEAELVSSMLDNESLAIQAWAKLILLEDLYGVKLSALDFDPNNMNAISGWSYQGINNVFDAVNNVADALWSLRATLPSYAMPQNKSELFMDIVGPLDIRLTNENMNHFAETFLIDPRNLVGSEYNIIEFYEGLAGSKHVETWEDSPWFKFNLVHEIGHVIANRVGGFVNREIDEFNLQYINAPEFRYLGWGVSSGREWLEADTRIQYGHLESQYRLDKQVLDILKMVTPMKNGVICFLCGYMTDEDTKPFPQAHNQ